MASKTEICNRALLKIGQPAIMSVDDDSPTARQCFQEYDAALEATLRSYPWPFAIARKELGRLTERPAFGAKYYYEIPADSLRLVEVLTYGHQYQIEGLKMASNAERVHVRYVSIKHAEANMDQQTADVVALYLASRLAIIITENPALKDMLFSEYNYALGQARNTWATENGPQHVIEGNWLNVHEFGWDGGTDRYFEKNIWNPWGPNGTGV